MKKYFRLILLGLLSILLFAPNVMAAKVYLSIDDSLDLAAIDGFQFDIRGGGDNVLTTYNTTVTNIDGTGMNGAITLYQDLIDNWSVVATSSGYMGYDLYLDAGNPGPLTEGIILSISSDNAMFLENFVLASSLHPSGNYQGAWCVVQSTVATGTMYTLIAPALECDYCFQDSKGYTWCMNRIAQNSVGLYLEGTCDTGALQKKNAKALYNWNGHLVMKAEGGADGILLQYHMRWGQTGLWINDTGANGQVEVSLIDCSEAQPDSMKIGEGRNNQKGSESTQVKTLEGFADAEYCLEDSQGYIWNLDRITQDDKGIYFTGTCDTGSEVIDVIATYIWARSGLAMSAFAGSVPNFTCSFRWGRSGQWIDSLSSTGTVDIGFCASGQ